MPAPGGVGRLIIAPSFWRAVIALPGNPVARREWRGLLRQSRDWRLWLGLRLPRDARGWGLPAVVWFSVAPYTIYLLARLGHRLAPAYFTYPSPNGWVSVDILALCMALLGVYVAAMGVALMAPTLVQERERETWEQLRTTVVSRDELLLGLLAGRLGPLLAGYWTVGLLWMVARPHYAPLLQSYAPFRLTEVHVSALVAATSGAAIAWGIVGLAASAWCRSTGAAVVAAMALTLVQGVLIVGLLVVNRTWTPGMVLAPVLTGAAAAGYLAARHGLRRD